MKKLGYILIGALLIVGVSSCEKEEIIPNFPSDLSSDSDIKNHDQSCFGNNGMRGNEGDPNASGNNDTNNGNNGTGIKDPDEDEDFDADDNIVDPDEDEDFEEEENGK